MSSADEWGQWGENAISTEEAKQLLREFFEILYTQEESDSGRLFNPVYISSCRVMKTKRLEEILVRLGEWSK